MKIQLVKAPPQNTGMPEHDWYPPLNLIWLANYLEPYGYDVEILDGQLLGLQKIIDSIDSELLGVSFDILSIDTFDSIVKAGKDRNCFTVAGGHLATALGISLISNNPNLDAIVRHDGEDALLGIANCISQGQVVDEKVPNILFRSADSIGESPVCEVDINILPLPKRNVGGIDLEVYFKNFQDLKSKLNLSFSYMRPTNAYSHKGCPFRGNGKGCSFCSRVDTRFRQKSADQVYKEYEYLSMECHADHISDFSDSWISTPFLRDLLRKYDEKGQINCSLRVYGDVRLINNENAKIMRDLGVVAVLLGIESGNENILKLNGKPTTISQILSAVSILADYEIKVADAYVLGLIGESRATIRDTVNLALVIRNLCETEISYWNIMTPLPGSRVWKYLANLDLFSKYGINANDYHFDPELLERCAIAELCNLGKNGYEYLVSVRDDMLTSSNVGSAEFVPNAFGGK
jgi:anaerobic magnesium-protoporphyrin IX monomethyl ester cyclase